MPLRTYRCGGASPQSISIRHNRLGKDLFLSRMHPQSSVLTEPHPSGKESPQGFSPAPETGGNTFLSMLIRSVLAYPSEDSSESPVCHCPPSLHASWKRTRCATNDSLGRHASLATMRCEALLITCPFMARLRREARHGCSEQNRVEAPGWLAWATYVNC